MHAACTAVKKRSRGWHAGCHAMLNPKPSTLYARRSNHVCMDDDEEEELLLLGDAALGPPH